MFYNSPTTKLSKVIPSVTGFETKERKESFFIHL
jgi:hypothetical protein